ncbi:porin family protein [Seonamhaeicola aphaedonensis]|uniref:Outer membrane protein with beta-barrel domain n=1 Tax=Seonamhaeicola aphaedonensis TaxID=1461338 RepID=A0A3D9HKH4_9FLAO|nr:porin family protein [Seonamhaeicola aphaedonensis]RED49990.1 outer membrane protein with beta-barrel domain [Seonamhaeicola aphaedonensis]
MKKIILTTVLLISIMSLYAQNFGMRAGADFATAKAEFDGFSISENETGVYIGLFARLNISESFKIRPETNYININDLDQIQIPILAEIGLSDKFNALAGPSFGFLLDTEEGSKSFNFGLDFGLSYDITKKFLVEARYSLGLSNLAGDDFFDASLKLHGLFVGVGYMF